MLLLAFAANAVPARRGLWQSVRLADGSSVRVQLVGDEHLHYMQAEDGTCYAFNDQTGGYEALSSEALRQRRGRAEARRAKVAAARKRGIALRPKEIFQGTKKALVILANFTDYKFRATHNLEHYKNVVNGIGLSDSEYKGSVRDYFRAQSGGCFDIDFDVVGPCPLAHNVSYYGRNVSGDDAHAGEMVAEACQWAHDNGVDFSQYDWDGDGEVDQVFVLYAGKGEANGGGANTIWPHMYQLQYSDYGSTMQFDGVTVDTYACSCELNGDSGSNGIGTFCHEFSHCMGFPDLYDTSYSKKWFCMGDFDLMDHGSYNGDGFVPAGYSAYEKNVCGWITLHDMTDTDSEQTIYGMKPVSEYGDAYIIKNKGNKDEYYIVELRSNTNWDAALPDRGVMITHVDYDPVIWAANAPNTYGEYYTKDDIEGTNPLYNYHPHLTIFNASNGSDDDAAFYPKGTNNALTRSSLPAASVYARNYDGTKFMHVGITGITVNSSFSEASFRLVPSDATGGGEVPEGSVLFYESFNKCDGKGGNDDVWSGSGVGVGVAQYDNAGWSSTGSIYNAAQCVKLGSASSNGNATSPLFAVNGSATLSFDAGAWNNNKDGVELLVSIAEGTGEIATQSFTMERGAWSKFSTQINATGRISLCFESTKGRFFLDEVKVIDNSATGIVAVGSSDGHAGIVGYYTLGGMRLASPQKGVNIVRYADGTSRKVIVI